MGCASEDVTSSADGGTSAAAEEESADKSFQLGSLLKPFDPPPFEELEKSAEWVDRPVLDGMEVLRKKQEAAGPPPVSVKEALALRNNSPQDNEQILATLSRIAPEDSSGVDYDTTWVRHVPGDLKSSNPLLLSSFAEFEYQALTALGSLFGLLGYDQDLNYFAPSEVVVSWQTSKDYLMDKLVLRDDLTWSDGKPITAHDVEFSFKVIMTDAVIVPAVRTGTDQLKWVKAYDVRTVVMFHKEALATNTQNIVFPVIPKHIYEK
ncbi:MAG: ABC transporter substrate-binding protein, partial [Pirellulales bacterium]